MAESFAARRAASYQSYYEHMPIRIGPEGTRGGTPTLAGFPLHAATTSGTCSA